MLKEEVKILHPKKKLKNGSFENRGFARSTFCDVKILTTAGAAFFTMGA